MSIRYQLNGPRVREALAAANLSITEGARRLDISRSYFSQLLAGTRSPSPPLRRRLLARSPFRRIPEVELWERTDG